MKKFFIKLSLFAPIFMAIVLFNYLVDPARLFKLKDFEKKVADVLIAGHGVTDLKNTNFDDRAMQRFLIESLKTPKDIAVLGSSRVMLISSDMFPGKALLNNTLSEATLQDYIGIYEIYRENKVLPSTVIIGADPWVFNKNNEIAKGHKFEKFYKWQQLFSVSYFQAGIQYLRSRPISGLEFALTDQKWNETQTLQPDGSITYSRKEREATLAEVRELVRQAKYEPKGLDKFTHLDSGFKQQFIKLIELMKDDGVRVVLFLPPYHPLAYDYCINSPQFKIIQEVEDFLKQTAQDQGLQLVGSYDPGALSLPESAFLDSLHLRDNTGIAPLFKYAINSINIV